MGWPQAIAAVASRWRCLAAALATLVAGCAHHAGQIGAVERHLAAGDPEAALERLESTPFAERDAALQALYRGMVLRLAGDRRASIAAFEDAIERMGELEATSLSETAGALVLTEAVRSYEGALYERILVHVLQALNHLERGDYEAARVEARRIDLGLRRIDNQLGRAPYGGDAFARYLTGLIYEAVGDVDDARIAYRNSWQAYRVEDSDRPNLAAPTHLGERLARLADEADIDVGVDGLPEATDRSATERGEGELFVVVFNGLVPARLSSSIWVQSRPSGELFRLSVPALRERPIPRGPARIEATPLADRSTPAFSVAAPRHRRPVTANTERVADVAAVARATLAGEIAAATARSVTRNVARHQITREVRKEDPLLAALVNVFGVIMLERADTRSWRTLPANISMARLSLPPGRYDIGVADTGASGAVLPEPEPVTLEAGDIAVRALHRLPRDPTPVRR